MSTDFYERAARTLRENPALTDLEGGFAEDAVIAAENAIGMPFPGDYRRFLTEFGCGTVGQMEIYGLVRDTTLPGIPNIVWLTLTNREALARPDHVLTISDDGYGHDLSMDCREGDDPAVRLWGSGVPFEEAEVRYASFGTFLLAVTEHLTM